MIDEDRAGNNLWNPKRKMQSTMLCELVEKPTEKFYYSAFNFSCHITCLASNMFD